jgi:hypothetical protein
MNPRLLVWSLFLFTVTSASALSIIGATDAGADSYERIILEEVLIIAQNQYPDLVSLEIRSFSDVTEEDIEENIIIFVKDGRVLLSVPDGVQSVIITYIEMLESWIAPYLPYMRVDSDTIIETGIDEQFNIGCFKSDSGLYEAGTTSGIMVGQTIPAEYDDLCVRDLLIEYACENDYVIRLEIPCDQGCAEGACIEPSADQALQNDSDAQPESERRKSGVECDTRWHWTREGFICLRPDIPIEETVIEPPEECYGCVSGERCMLFGDRLPDEKTCTGLGIVCLGCEADGACIPNRRTASDGRVCIAGALKDMTPRPEPIVEPEPVRERQPIEELFIPEPAQKNKGLFAIIADFFRNLFVRS